MSELYNVAGTYTPAPLLADPQGADVIAVPLTPGQGTVKRGTVIYRASNGMWLPAASGQISTSYMLAVLAEDVNTDASATVAEDAPAYRAGRFIDGRVKLAAAADVTAAHKVVLRMMGIVFDVADDAAGLHNIAATITYVANNGADPAEADVVNHAPYNTAYTILANSTTDFTAPATKAFSKWNTKADGSGTDYAAAASYTATADLKLYAVWA